MTTHKMTARSAMLTAALFTLTLALCGAAQAGYLFGDHNANWTGYSGMSDENGVPIFPGKSSTPAASNNKAGVVEVNPAHNNLLSIAFNYERGNLNTSLWPLLKPGDLFLDVDGNAGWDYVVRSPVATNGVYSADANSVLAAGEWTVYAFNNEIGLGDVGQYMLANETTRRNGTPWGSSIILRGYHPWALDQAWLDEQLEDGLAQAVGTVDFSGWQDPAAFTHTATNGQANQAGWSLFDFTDNALFSALEMDKLVFSFTVSCANDVLIESIPLEEPTGDPVPEPASLLIWGLLGLSFAGGSWRLAFRRRWTDWDDQ